MPKRKLTFKEAFKELEEILKEIESQDLDVDYVAQKVKRATDLIKFCRQKIKSAEFEVKKIIKDFEKELDIEEKEDLDTQV